MSGRQVTYFQRPWHLSRAAAGFLKKA